MAYSSSTGGRGNPRTRLSGTTHKQLLSFSTYVDKGSKQIFKKWGDMCRETAKQAIIEGYNSAFIKAKQDVGRQLEDVNVFGMPAPGGGLQQFVNRASTSKYQGKQLTKHNRNRASSAEQRIWDSLGFNFLTTKGSYVNAIAGSVIGMMGILNLVVLLLFLPRTLIPKLLKTENQVADSI